ncbi:MAG TPA: gluconeogenesis factor YvcK family protein, partial [Patescibacteria group bacterium]
MKKIVFIGGGGGSKNILPGLKNDFDCVAVVTTFDNGGSYGQLRYQYQTVLSGDVRDALIALADNANLADIWQWRFAAGDFKGHSLGNLFLANLYDNLKDYNQVLKLASEILKVKGKVGPVSFDWAELTAELTDGTIIAGETKIDEVEPGVKRSPIKKVYLSRPRRQSRRDKPVKVNPEVVEAIVEADLIIIGPGDLYTSLIPNFLPTGVTEAIKKSKAKKVYFINKFTTLGQTDSLTAFDHAVEIENYLGSSLDVVVINSSLVSDKILEHYRKRNERLVEVDLERLKSGPYQIIEADLLADEFVEKAKSDKLK